MSQEDDFGGFEVVFCVVGFSENYYKTLMFWS